MIPAIVDSHLHFWDPAMLRYAWLAGEPAINRTFLPADLAAAARDFNLQQIVFVQADCAPEQGVQETAWVSSLAYHEPRLAGIVAFAPLEQGEGARAHLQALAAYPLVKGVRRLIQSEGPGFCTRPDFVRGVQLLAEFSYSFDICVFHHQLGDVLRLVDACPDVPFVLDHLGKPAVREGLLEPWRTQIAALAAYPHIYCKISGLVTEADRARWTPAQLQPYVEHALAAFGPDRVMYGGDWPVSTLATSYGRWIETLDRAAAALDEQARHKLFCSNAQAFYRLEGAG